MPISFYLLAEAAAIAFSLSIDAFTAGFAYGSKGIKIPAVSLHIVNVICAAVTGAALLAGSAAAPFLPGRLPAYAAFALLFVIGLIKLMDSAAKSFIRRLGSSEVRFSLFDIKFIIRLYADPERADADCSKRLSPAEAAALALSLSLDGAAVGFGAALAASSAPMIVAWSLVTNAALMAFGAFLGGKAAKKLPFDASWAGGVILIGLAVTKLL